ncbi:MAG: DmsE family decaheme c-type cytochrome [Nitrospinota bacterium]|nr:DmsE family decaheme c-type cytochrome [Nitrospinota bacterium]
MAAPTAMGSVSAEGAQDAVKKCGKCHKDYVEKWLPTKHGQIFTKNPENEKQAMGCVTCHGDGERHMTDAKAKSEPGSAPVDKSLIVRLGKDTPLSKAEQRAICMNCHFGGENMTHWMGSSHENANLSCLDCHQRRLASIQVKLVPQTRRQPEQMDIATEVCINCHVQKRASMMRSSHMPLREGKITCVDCHEAHGGKGPANLRQASVNENCYSCHAEKRGPMLWEHPPVREYCGNCHDPHGSNYENLLKMKKPYLCESCHQANYHPSNIYSGGGLDPEAVNPTTGAAVAMAKQQVYRGCTNCHMQVHGSNHPSGPRLTR